MKAAQIVEAVVAVRRRLIDRGYCPDAVAHAIQRVGLRVLDGGMGKVQQTRRLQRDLYPGLTPRYVAPGERCVVVPSYPGRENEYWAQIAQYQAQGFTISEGQAVTYACPPGQSPMEVF